VSSLLLWPLLAAASSTAPVLLACGPLSNARSATKIAAWAALVMAGVNIGLNALLIPRFGLLGCAWATALAYYCSALVWMLFTRDFFPDRLTARNSFFLSLPALAGAVCAQVFRDNPFIPTAVVLILAALSAYMMRAKIESALAILLDPRLRRYQAPS
jgi:peptidoglycan biosynthesis protein MviN/MurJ (putative lipid II flippase)